MKRFVHQIVFLLLFTTAWAQEPNFRFSGQLSTWGQFTPDLDKTLWFGGRYIPQIKYTNHNKFDLEASANIFGDFGMKPFSQFESDGTLKPYRLWVRFATNQMEFRAGLQKINFGSAQMLRPLMWFDKMDARDPLQMTDGVWGGLFRYYFKNNANIWLWGLAMNKDAKIMKGDLKPEVGARVQFPINRGEMAFSYTTHATKEHRMGFDVRADVVVGFWFETSWTYLTDSVPLKNQLMTTIGGDYTIGTGNGLGITLEHLLFTGGSKVFDYNNNAQFTAVNLTYPLSFFGNANAILYYDWKNKNVYNFAGYNHQFKNITLYLMAYLNPKTNALPMQSGFMRFTGKGVQLMAVWNY
ncbi:MAG: hypothetical protein FWD56_02220 [Bacteroidales bacterium]|nr:hypothetical protein [Bacteroidales bacterium]